MAKITKISVQQKDKARVNIFLDGEYFCALDYFTSKKYRLSEGVEITEEELDKIRIDSNTQRLFEKSVNLISLRPRSETEIREYLKNKEAKDDEAEIIIEKLKRYDFINDTAFAEYFISSHKKRWGAARIKAELRSYGVESGIIEQGLEEMGGQEDEAYSLAQKFLRSKSAPDFNKLYAHLYSKGFKSDDIKAAFVRLKEEILSEAENSDSSGENEYE